MTEKYESISVKMSEKIG